MKPQRTIKRKIPTAANSSFHVCDI